MYPLLKNAPPHDSEEFIDYLRKNNKVIFENDQWIIIANCKYDKPKKRWYTAFHKGSYFYDDMDILWYKFGDLNWLKKSKKKQTVKRFHIHMYK